MDNTIQSTNSQENIHCLLPIETTTKELCKKLIGAHIPFSDICVDEDAGIVYVNINLTSIHAVNTLKKYEDFIHYTMQVEGGVENISLREKIFFLQKQILDMPEDISKSIREYDYIKKQLSYYENIHEKHKSVVHGASNNDLLDSLFNELAFHKGKSIIGISTPSVPELDKMILGLRKLCLLTAGPNVGKTAFMVQLAIDALQNNPEVCLVFVSLEMTESEIYERMFRYLAETSWKELHLKGNGNIEYAKQEMMKLHPRIKLLGAERFVSLTSQIMINTIQEFKKSTGCEKVFVCVDYLQVWPIPEGTSASTGSDLDKDKWQIAQMEEISRAFPDNAVLVITESRKPSSFGGVWGGTIADIAGSARIGYAADMILQLIPLSDSDILELLDIHCLRIEKSNEGAFLRIFKKFFSMRESSLCYIRATKGRDGMNKFQAIYEFKYHQNKFLPATHESMGELFGDIISSLPKKEAKSKKEAND